MNKLSYENEKDAEKLQGKMLEALFWAFFNNKMTILLMMIEHPEIARRSMQPEKSKVFLHDMYHHFLTCGAPAQYRRAFKWLNAFLQRYPNVNYMNCYKANKMVSLVYEAFGRKLDSRLEAKRIEREQ